ncbi:hypothetical protein RND81_11G190000 [Saponaria officinalis]|uniref:Uncharacterized protein n=1 Tax=Saponaria officinalis TaxID=3572 RepID=A0AAW1HN39_SAPOF
MKIMKVFTTFVFFVLFIGTTGHAQKCTISDMKVKITRTGKAVEGAPEWVATIYNTCTCPQSNVYLKCTGFNSYEVISPSIFKVVGDICLINSGKPIVKGVPVSFNFAFNTPFDLLPFKSTISC